MCSSWGWLEHPHPPGPKAFRFPAGWEAGGRGWLPGCGAAVTALAGARVAAAAERRGTVGIPHTHGWRGAPGGREKRQVLVLAGGQLRTLGEHRQAAAAQRAPTLGSPPGKEGEGRVRGTEQTGVTEQTVQIKMENQEEAGPSGSPGQRRKLSRAMGQGWGPATPTESPQRPGSRVPQAQKQGALHELRRRWRGTGRQA